MTDESTPRKPRADNLWVIAPSKSLPAGWNVMVDKPADEADLRLYRISDFARYLLNPNSIEVEKRLVGSEVHYKQQRLVRLWRRLLEALPDWASTRLRDRGIPPEVLTSDFNPRVPRLRDSRLQAHIQQAYDGLKPHDSIVKRFKRLDANVIEDLVGICEDVAGNRSKMQIRGDVEAKLRYLETWMLRDVIIILESAYLGDGLFELEGYDFSQFAPDRFFWLMSFEEDSKRRCCVLVEDGSVDFRVADPTQIRHLLLLEQCLATSPEFQSSLDQCVAGRAHPLKLLFKRDLEINYSRMHPPETYREVFRTQNIDPRERDAVLSTVNHLQMGVSFTYVPVSETESDRILTNIAVMHDMRALDPFKANFPNLYSEIAKRAHLSEAGRYYLLDSIHGSRNEK